MKHIKNTEKPVQKYRFYIQSFFAAICIWIGIDFFYFVRYLQSNGVIPFSERPPGVEGFLPISSIISVYNFFLTGKIHNAHPAGFFIFIAILAVSFIWGKSFCSWICPVGFISELLGEFSWKIQKKVFRFKKMIRLPKYVDYFFRSFKYLLLAFFIYAIFFAMSQDAVLAFLDSPYNIVSDVKMYYFFADISRFALIVITMLFTMSVVLRNFWCRYLCPYGALLGITSLLSLHKIKRNEKSCIDCGLCAKACPSLIKVDKVKTVISDECSTCMSCVDVCPVKDTLDLKTIKAGKKIHKPLVVFTILIIFFGILGIGYFSGHWQNKISKEEYLEYHKNLNSLGHPTTASQIEELNRDVEK